MVCWKGGGWRGRRNVAKKSKETEKDGVWEGGIRRHEHIRMYEMCKHLSASGFPEEWRIRDGNRHTNLELGMPWKSPYTHNLKKAFIPPLTANPSFCGPPWANFQSFLHIRLNIWSAATKEKHWKCFCSPLVPRAIQNRSGLKTIKVKQPSTS